MRSSTGEARWRDGEMPRRGRDMNATAVTSPQVLALDTDGEPLRPALLWMDSRAAPQAYVRDAGRDRNLGEISRRWVLICRDRYL